VGGELNGASLWWIPLVGTLIGGVLTLLGGFLTQRLAFARDREQRRKNFQRGTLLNLQADLLHISRAVHKNENYTLPWRRSTIMVVRVEDAAVRNLVQVFKQAVDRRDTSAISQIFEDVNARIGEILRQL
jgi:hypothetical protein